MNFIHKLVFGMVLVSLAFSFVALAQEDLPSGFEPPLEVPTTGADLIGLITTAGNWVFAIFLAISLIYILLAAFQFITGGGEPEKISEARQKLIYAIIGIAIALVASGLDDIIRSVLGLTA